MLPSDSTNPAVQRMDQLAREFNLTFPFHLPANSKDERNSSNLIWVVLFSMLFILSFLSNISLILAVLSNSRKRTGVHLIICLLFLVNLVDYGLLILEFSTGVSSHFPWGEESCAVYQYFLQSNPLYYSALLVLLVYHASKPAGGLNTVWWNLVLLVILVLLVSLPTILYSDTAVYPSGARFCVMDLGGVAGWAGLGVTQSVTALYYLIYRSVLPYFLPLCVLARPLYVLYQRINGPEDKNCTVSLSLAVVFSYFVFYSCYSAICFIRHSIDVSSFDVTTRTSWILAVLQSLFSLLATFQHVFRPLLCFVLDIDLRKDFVVRLSGRSKNVYQSVQQSSVV